MKGKSICLRLQYSSSDIDGSDLARIGHAESPPTWSPDGEELAFVSVEEEEVVVYASSPDGAVQREVWRGTGGYGQAYWSPDGTEILVITDQAYLVSADGGEQRALAPDRMVSHAAWSPDGSMIALRDSNSISIVSRDGTDLRVVAEAGRNGTVTIVLPVAADCEADGANCKGGLMSIFFRRRRMRLYGYRTAKSERPAC